MPNPEPELPPGTWAVQVVAVNRFPAGRTAVVIDMGGLNIAVAWPWPEPPPEPGSWVVLSMRPGEAPHHA